MIGDNNDVQNRIQRLLPPWFGPGPNAVLSAVLAGFGAAYSFIYSLYAYAALQTRIATAVDGWLDLIAWDFFGPLLQRKTGQSDTSLRAVIEATLLRPAGTRPAMFQAILTLTGNPPIIIEPQRPADCGGYGIACGYGAGGWWGSMRYPYQAFIQVQLPTTGGIPNVTGFGFGAGGYNVGGQIEYADLSMVAGQITAQDVYDVVNAVKPEGTIAWVRAA